MEWCPKLTQNGAQNWPKIWPTSGPDMGPELAQNGPKIGPETEPEMDQKRSPGLTQSKRPKSSGNRSKTLQNGPKALETGAELGYEAPPRPALPPRPPPPGKNAREARYNLRGAAGAEPWGT